ncbi:class I SAM-dependent methyltransferase [archaeon]|jgi:16S rRNA (guanine1207-N2)-methyltransferase|nr:class I SAM-dependent methyltransferase [archaeon]MBT4351735.1 class I SAM-dependent methyltransferase [archaeon]MBT4646756.1 class I SAM-dependent methyltransferase [archaeon]MBT6822049.1 class I SAM-dependent methyltransferase [archaeon]MBT7391435.1 class I SAM-dependent methyltransferase [archaeon]
MSHYFSKKQDTEFIIKKIEVNVAGLTFELLSSSGVFSKDELDKGSKILIENSIIEDGWEVLDLGCGYGVVGISIKKMYPTTNVLMSDINQRAVSLSKKNIRLHQLKDIKAKDSDNFEKIDEKFDTILLNPPQTAGKDICFKMIEDSFDHIKSDGLLQLVARHNKGGKTLSKKMMGVFGNAKDIVIKSGYRVYVSIKN